MKNGFSMTKARRSGSITTADIGRYLKNLAVLHRDRATGNPAMSDALEEISMILVSARANTATKTIKDFVAQERFDFEDAYDFQGLSLDAVKEILNRVDLTKSDLVMIGSERFGIAKSRMEKLSRIELIRTITAVMQHEESLTIISEEAKRYNRTS